jgi:hypothetical protein
MAEITPGVTRIVRVGRLVATGAEALALLPA